MHRPPPAKRRVSARARAQNESATGGRKARGLVGAAELIIPRRQTSSIHVDAPTTARGLATCQSCIYIIRTSSFSFCRPPARTLLRALRRPPHTQYKSFTVFREPSSIISDIPQPLPNHCPPVPSAHQPEVSNPFLSARSRRPFVLSIYPFPLATTIITTTTTTSTTHHFGHPVNVYVRVCVQRIYT